MTSAVSCMALMSLALAFQAIFLTCCQAVVADKGNAAGVGQASDAAGHLRDTSASAAEPTRLNPPQLLPLMQSINTALRHTPQPPKQAAHPKFLLLRDMDMAATGAALRPFTLLSCAGCPCEACVYHGINSRGLYAPVATAIFGMLLPGKCSATDGSTATANPSVVDAGAGVGYFTILAAAAGCDVLSFEPQEVPRDMLRASAVLNGLDARVHVHPYALSRAAGQTDLRIGKYWGGGRINSATTRSLAASRAAAGSSAFASTSTAMRSSHAASGADAGAAAGAASAAATGAFFTGWPAQPVSVRPLSGLVPAAQEVLLLRIDTGGAEGAVLAGAQELLLGGRVHNVIMSVRNIDSRPIRDLLRQTMEMSKLTHAFVFVEDFGLLGPVTAVLPSELPGRLHDVSEVLSQGHFDVSIQLPTQARIQVQDQQAQEGAGAKADGGADADAADGGSGGAAGKAAGGAISGNGGMYVWLAREAPPLEGILRVSTLPDSGLMSKAEAGML